VKVKALKIYLSTKAKLFKQGDQVIALTSMIKYSEIHDLRSLFFINADFTLLHKIDC
jgi:hypothetical protein